MKINVWCIGDTHFSHANIITYCNRPFVSVKEMDDTIVKNWNRVVNPHDYVYHVGDFAFKLTREQELNLLYKLNGHKILIIGNHDKRSLSFYQDNFTYAAYRIDLKDYILTHYPIDGPVPQGKINIHGHIHNNSVIADKQKRNVSVEVLNYVPTLLYSYNLHVTNGIYNDNYSRSICSKTIY